MKQGTEVIAAIAQETFWSNENQFCTVRPLAIIEDDKLVPIDISQFPNRDSCWWLVRGIITQREIIPGRLIVGRIEDAEQFDKHDPDKDMYQLEWSSVRLAGGKNIIEIVDGALNIEPRELINLERIIKIDHPPSSLVLVRIGDQIYGPFKAEHEKEDHHYWISLSKPQSSEYTSVFKADIIRNDQGYIALKGIRLSADSRPVNRSTDLFFPSYQILSWSRFEALQGQATEKILLFSDEEIVRQAAKQVLSRKKLRDFMKDWSSVSDAYLASQAEDSALETGNILKTLDKRLKAKSDAIENFVQSVLKSGILDSRIGKAIESSVKEHIDTRAAQLSSQAEERIKTLRQEEEKLAKQVKGLSSEQERKTRQQEEQLKKELKERKEEFEEWVAQEKSSIQRERDAVEAKRKLLEEGLKEVSARFKENRDELVRDFLSLSPFLSQLGAIPTSNTGTVTKEKEEQKKWDPLILPAFLVSNKGATGLEEERGFFERFHDHVNNSGFRFNKLDLVSFHLSVKCGDLTILGGLSGTGKSSLPLLYAQALAGDQQRFLAVDVNPAWLEPGDLLGRPNLLEEKFQPAPTGLFEHLIFAAKEAENVGGDSGIWIVCLDEMNLAQPEHYFSGFLQALPRCGDQRYVNVFSPSSVRSEDPLREWHKIPLKNNLRFVGTVNYDETTKALSQRLLDRANELRLDAVPFGSLSQPASTEVEPPKGLPVTVTSYDSWIRDSETLPSKAAEIIDSMQKPLSVLGSPITPRRFQAIARFVASARNLCSADEAFDIQLRQRVFSQLRGLFRPESRRALDELRSILAKHGESFSRAQNMLDTLYVEYSNEIDFEGFEEEH